MERKMKYIRIFGGCVLLLVVYVMIISYKILVIEVGKCTTTTTWPANERQHIQDFVENSNTKTLPSNILVQEFVGKNNNTKPWVSSSGERNLYFNEKPTKHMCYHLNWTENTLTRDIFSKCGFISISKSEGRTGNQMFQVAALFGTAYKLDMIPIIQPSFPLLDDYNLPNVMNISLSNVHECVEEEKIRKYTECFPGPSTFVNMTMTGYRQSWKYFKDIKGDVARIFGQNFKTNSLAKAADFIKNVTNSSSYQLVGIHIRRTDLHEIRANNSKWDRIADVEYFNRAMSYFKLFYKQIRYIVVSDDIRWAKGNLKSDDIFYSPFTELADDLALMSICDHMIVTYGTFGWWGAWLANGTTVFFRESFHEPIEIRPVGDSEHYLIPGSIEIP